VDDGVGAASGGDVRVTRKRPAGQRDERQAEPQLALHRKNHRRCIDAATIMASTISFGDANAGFQAGIVNGPVSTTFNLPPGKLLNGANRV
jgi:hypothetical protein